MPVAATLMVLKVATDMFIEAVYRRLREKKL
jgi:hypothetical protein